mmetsp:Transcript_24791/g.57303  ORF Transcript_24791/g.57303 Transcript_24791/m.57303 type:complete len:373 (-) Transcript_24791:130-1248(-)
MVKLATSNGCSNLSLKANGTEVHVSIASRADSGEARGRWNSRAPSAGPADGESLPNRSGTAAKEPRSRSMHDRQRSAAYRKCHIDMLRQPAPQLELLARPPGLSGMDAPPTTPPPTENLPPPTSSSFEVARELHKKSVQQIIEVTGVHVSHAERALEAAGGDVGNAMTFLLDQATQQEMLLAAAKTVATQQAVAQQMAAQQEAAKQQTAAQLAAAEKEKRTAKAAAETTALLRDAQLASVAKQAAAELAAKKKVADKLRETAAATAANKVKQHAANVVAKEAANVAAKEAEEKAKAKVVEATTAMPKPTPATRSAAAAPDNHYVPTRITTRTTLSGPATPKNIISNTKASASSASPPTTSKLNPEASASSMP